MDSYVKMIKLNAEFDDKSLKQLTSTLNTLSREMNISFDMDAISKDYKDMATTLSSMQQYQQQIKNLTNMGVDENNEIIQLLQEQIRLHQERLNGHQEEQSEIDKQLETARKLNNEIASIKERLSEVSKLGGSAARQEQSKLEKQLTERQEQLTEISISPDEQFGQDLQSDFKNFKTDFSQAIKSESISAGTAMGNAAAMLISKAASAAKKLFEDAWSEMNDMMSQSYLTNKTTWENLTTYGMSSSESYGFEQAKSMLGITDEEQLYRMSDTQKQMFSEVMEKYTARYQELVDSGYFDKMLEFQVEYQEFQQDLKLEVVEFFMEHKDTIVKLMDFTMDFFEFIMDSLDWLVDHFGGEGTSDYSRQSTLSDIINNASYDNSKTTNVKIDNTFNNVSKSDQSWLSNAGEMTYQQTIKALTGGD